MRTKTSPVRPRRVTGFVGAIAILAALLSPLVGAGAAQASEIIGTTSGVQAAAWIDQTLTGEMTVGTSYSSSVQAPPGWGPYSDLSYDMPDGLEASLDPNTGVVTVSGTPTTYDPEANLTLWFSGSDGVNFSIQFYDIDVRRAVLTTAISAATAATFAPYTAVTLSSTLVPAANRGTVDFYLDATFVANVPVQSNGTAHYTGPVPASLVGSNAVLSAVYSGAATWAASTSTNAPTVYIYGDRSVTGILTQNGQPVIGEEVDVLAPATGSIVAGAITDDDGRFTSPLPDVTTLAEAQATYLLLATVSGVYYSTAGGVGQPNVTTFAAATAFDQAAARNDLNLFVNVAPVWTNNTIATPHLHTVYTDGVAASGTATIVYSISAGALPSWLSLDPASGALTSADPTDQTSHSFTIRAANDFGSITQAFTIAAGAAGVAPSFAQVNTTTPVIGHAFTGGIPASGDATIIYTSTALPDGLVLNSATGEVTGIATTPGAFSVTFTATNDFGHDTRVWTGTIVPAPELSLVLDFAAGDTVGDAETEISADGLKVGSTYTLDLHSSPIRLYTGIVDGTGGFTWLVTLPASTPVGAHELILTGVAPDGTVMTAHAWFTLLANGQIGATSYTGAIPFRLAFTGTEPIVPLGVASALLIAGFLLLRRRRSLQQS